jgi:hypothetical protein
VKNLNILIGKVKEVLFSILPITIIVLLLHLTITPIETDALIRFIIGAMIIIIGLSIFLFGIDIGISPIGTMMGEALTKSNKVWIVGLAGLVIGFIISIAEPALHILANQIDGVTAGSISRWSIVIAVSIGLAIMVAIGLLRTVFNIALYKLLTIIYGIIFILALFTPSEFLVIAFDASGATTGAMAVPFMLALSIGVATMKKRGVPSSEDSFGLVAIASAGAIMGVMIMSIFSDVDQFTGSLDGVTETSNSIIQPFLSMIPIQTMEVLFSLAPLLLIFITLQLFFLHLPRRNVNRILKGLLYTTIGLILFLTGVNAGFMEVGSKLGYLLGDLNRSWFVVLIGFILGLVIILAEPAVYVLIRQIEDVTSGSIKKVMIMVTLGLGVGIAVALSMLRILIPNLQLWHYLLPGYLIALILMYLVPKLFVGIAFDSGGVASGPMIGTFILAFAQGVAEATEGANVLIDGFGMISMVALTPLIALQILGFIFKLKTAKGGIR